MENLREKTIEGLFSKIAAGTYSTKAGFFDFFHLSFIAARRLYAKMGAKKVGDVWYIDDVPWFKHFTWASRTYCAYLFTVVFEAGNHVSKR